MQKWFRVNWLVLALIAALAFPGAAAAESPVYPEVISLPDGWLPEGITVGAGHTFYAGSRANGAVYRGDLRTGEGEIFVPGVAGRVAVGLKYDQSCDILLVSGGDTGQAYIYDGTTAQTLQVLNLSGAPAFINDVVVTNNTAYFTNSQKAEFYSVDLSNCRNGTFTFQTIALSGEWQQVMGFNANGIVAHPNGKSLIVVNSTTGILYRVDPQTGFAEAIDLGGATVTAGDGLLLQGQTLYVVRNRLNQIAVVELSPDWSSGVVVDTITNANFDVPTTIAKFGSALYAVNGRFTTPPTPTTPYTVVRVELQ